MLEEHVDQIQRGFPLGITEVMFMFHLPHVHLPRAESSPLASSASSKAAALASSAPKAAAVEPPPAFSSSESS